MANATISNKFDNDIKIYTSTDKVYDAGSIADFTDNKLLAEVKKQIAAMAPEATLNVYGYPGGSQYRLFSFNLEYKLVYSNINQESMGFCIKLDYIKTQNECDKYTLSLCVLTKDRGLVDISLPNKAKAFINNKGCFQSSSDKKLIFFDPQPELVKNVIDAMITPNRRKAFKEFIEVDKKDAMESANTKTMLDIETMDIIPELENIAKEYSLGTPTVVEEPYCRKVVLIHGEYGAALKLEMYKPYMHFTIVGGVETTSDKFDTNFIKLLKGILGKSNIDIATYISYDNKEQVYDMLKRIGTCYQKTRFLMTYESWFNIDPVWKRNPDRPAV